MSELRIGSLCSGYGGLDLGLMDAVGGNVAWHAETDPAAARVLAERWPGVPNLGDITTVDWATAPDVDWLTAGYPCTPFSDAGLRKGTDDERHLWPYVARAIRILRPRLVALENVRGHLRRGFVHVLNGLAAFGYVGSYALVRASDVGACHRRERLFVIAADAARLRHGHGWPTARAGLPPGTVGGPAGTAAGGVPPGDPVLRLLPTPRSVDATGPNLHGDGGLDLRSAVQLMPTPAARDAKGPFAFPKSPDLGTAVTLMPTPRASDGVKGSPNQHGSSGDLMLPSAAQPERSNAYAAAIERWADVLGRPAPAPTERYPGGSPLLSPRFVEFMMGLEPGWVTAVPRMTRNDALRILGNGVVVQQAAYAIRLLLARRMEGGA